MRVRAETLLLVSLSVFGTTGLAAVALDRLVIVERPGMFLADPIVVEPDGSPYGADAAAAAAWFSEARPDCTAARAAERLREEPAPRSDQGTVYKAACLALAGDVSSARTLIDGLPASRRGRAADVVFGIGHPVADRGEEVAVGPLMELVVSYRPNQYMALYHAGSAAYRRGDESAARDYLGRFLGMYAVADGWRANARTMMDALPER